MPLRVNSPPPNLLHKYAGVSLPQSNSYDEIGALCGKHSEEIIRDFS